MSWQRPRQVGEEEKGKGAKLDGRVMLWQERGNLKVTENVEQRRRIRERRAARRRRSEKKELERILDGKKATTSVT